MAISNHYQNDRKIREMLIKNVIGYGKPIAQVTIDRGHVNGAEIHVLSDTGIITVYNARTKVLVTRMIGKPTQIQNRFKDVPVQVLKFAREHQKLGYNK